MKINLEKLKAVLYTSLAGGGIGALLSSVATSVAAILAPGPQMTLGMFLGGAVLMGSFGAFAAGGFATMLALSKDHDGIENLSVARGAILGLIAGGLFPTAVALLTGEFVGYSDWAGVALFSVVFGVLGSGVTAGLVAVAKDAPSRICPPSSPDCLLESGEPI